MADWNLWSAPWNASGIFPNSASSFPMELFQWNFSNGTCQTPAVIIDYNPNAGMEMIHRARSTSGKCEITKILIHNYWVCNLRNHVRSPRSLINTFFFFSNVIKNVIQEHDMENYEERVRSFQKKIDAFYRHEIDVSNIPVKKTEGQCPMREAGLKNQEPMNDRSRGSHWERAPISQGRGSGRSYRGFTAVTLNRRADVVGSARRQVTRLDAKHFSTRFLSGFSSELTTSSSNSG